MKITILTALAIISFVMSLSAADSILAANVKWKGPFGRADNQTGIFNLMARGFFQKPASSEMDDIVATWLRDHPKAIVVPVASFDIDPEKRRETKVVYVWITDGESNLNLELIRRGCFASECQTIMPEIPAYSRPNAPKPSNPVSQGQKLEVPQADYDAFVQKALDAGKQAREKKLGVWKDSTE